MRYLIALILFISSVSVNAQLINGTEVKHDTASIKTNAARELYVDSNYIKLFSGSITGNFLPLAGGTMEPGASIFFGTGGQNISQGTFDNGTGGNNGISLNCAIGYELNWQGGHLSSSFSGGNYVPIIIDSNLTIKALAGGGVQFVTTDDNGNLGTAPFISLPIQDADVFDPDYGNVRDAILNIDFDQGQNATDIATLNGQVTAINSAISDVVSFSDTLTKIATKEDVANISGGGGGSVTNFTFLDGNGFKGTVNNSTTTPELELFTDVTGIVIGDGSKIDAAIPGVDYVSPTSSETLSNKSGNISMWGNDVGYLTPTTFPNGIVHTNNLSQRLFGTSSNTLYLYTGSSGLQFTNQANTTSLGTLSNTGDLSITGNVTGANLSIANWNSAYTNRITSLTTTGTSGAATLSSNVLNIPNYTLAGLGGTTLANVNAQNLSSFATTTSAQLRSVLSDEDGTGNILTTNGSAANLTSFPTLNQNTTGTASNLSGTPALPNGTTATTQATGDNTTKIATDAFVIDAIKYGKIYDQSVTVVAGTNTTSEEVLAYKLIPGGTLQVGDRIEIRALFIASSGTASKTCKVKVHSASSVGGTAFSTTANTSSTSTHVHNTGFAVVAASGSNNLVSFMPGGQALMTGIISAGSQVATLPIASDIYIQFTTTKATGSDVISLYMYDIKILRP